MTNNSSVCFPLHSPYWKQDRCLLHFSAQKDMLSPLNEKLLVRRLYSFPFLLSRLIAVNMCFNVCAVISVFKVYITFKFSSFVHNCVTFEADSLAGAKSIYRYSKLFSPLMLFWYLEINTPVLMWFDWHNRGCSIQILPKQWC